MTHPLSILNHLLFLLLHRSIAKLAFTFSDKILLFLFLNIFSTNISFSQNTDNTDPNRPLWLHHVKPSDNLNSVAREYGLSETLVKQQNPMADFRLTSTEKLRIPVELYNKKADKKQIYLLHKVGSKDKIHTIASHYGSTVAEIKRINRTQNNFLKVGSYILVPNRVKTPKIEQLTINAFASLGFFAGNSWDGTTKVNYSINGRVNLRNVFQRKPFRMLTSFQAALGYRHDIGEYFFKNIDRFEVKNQAEYQVNKVITPFLFTSFRNQFLNSYRFDSQGNKTLTASNFAPAYSHVAIGIVFFGNFYNIDIGLLELKTTYVFNPLLFEGRSSVFGVQKRERTYSEFGISLRADFFFYEGEKIKAQANLYSFANRDGIDVDFRSEFSYQITRFLRIAALAELYYDKDFADQIQFKNEILLGFSFYKK